MQTQELYQIAEDDRIPIFVLPIPESGSMCIQTERGCYIGLDDDVLESEASQRVHLAHELGHCITGAFYNRWAARDLRQKHEDRANRWAIQRLISQAELDQAVTDGYTSVWQLAEYFNVTEDFMRKAICWYTHGNLAANLYF